MHCAIRPCFFTLSIAGIVLMSSPVYSKIDSAIDARSFTGAYLAGRIANHENETNLAINYFKQALTYNPNNIDAQKEIFEAMLSVGAFKEAVKQAKKLKAQNISHPFISLTLSIDNLIKKNYKDVKPLPQLKTSPSTNNPAFDVISAWATFGSGNHSQAIADLKKLLGPIWYNLFIHYHLALMSDLAKRPKEAKKYFMQALNNQQGAMISPDTYERIIIAYASFQLRQKMRNQAIQTIQNGEKMLSDREILKNIRQKVEKGANLENPVKTPQQGAGEILYDFGTTLNRRKSEYVARIFKQLSLALYPQNDATLFQLANVSAKLNDPHQAIKLYRALSPHSPYYREGQLQLALTLANNNQHTEAIKLLTSLEKKNPNDRAIYIALSAIYMQKNNFAEAAKIMDRAIIQTVDFQKDDWKLFYQRGIAFERLKHWTKAETDLRKALELFPEQPHVLNYLGYTLIDRDQKLEESLSMLQKASALQPKNGYILDSLGWAHYKLKQYNQAVEILETAVKLQPQDPILNDHLGDVYWKVGRKREAIFQWNHAIDGQPENLEKIKEKLKFGLQDTTMLDHAKQ
ncbi:tetratricopeptide repeat protein [Bartonella schoenbuchensis]|uniref:tetratricopeptide repeat protein n=1 Tax=Bartonella schoenbuchensis TaxID=165694 RepID=UPI003144F660